MECLAEPDYSLSATSKAGVSTDRLSADAGGKAASSGCGSGGRQNGGSVNGIVGPLYVARAWSSSSPFRLSKRSSMSIRAS